MNLKLIKLKSAFIILICTLSFASQYVQAGNKRLMSITSAKTVARRALTETIHGLTLESTESVINMVATNIQVKTETKTLEPLKGVTFDEPIYREGDDIAYITAYVNLPSISSIDGRVINLQNKVFKRVGFATSTQKSSHFLKALRAAEIDAYLQLTKRILGMRIKGKTTVDNYILTSDIIKSKVKAMIFLAEFIRCGPDKYGNAFVDMQLNVNYASTVLGETIEGGPFIKVRGQGAVEDDFKMVGEK